MPLAHLLDDRNTGYAPKQQFLHRVKTRPAAATTSFVDTLPHFFNILMYPKDTMHVDHLLTAVEGARDPNQTMYKK